ncbi:MAG: amidase [Gemmatimonadetes bacterium]|nr:amidase [Gemmatimonadota bacterium]
MSDELPDGGRAPGLPRREFLWIIGAAAVPAVPAVKSGGLAESILSTGWRRPPAVDVVELDLAAMSAGLDAGRWTSVDLVEGCLGRIAALDRQGPSLHHILESNPEALEVAAARDRERSRGDVRGPLHGVPVVLKDNIDTADGMSTTAGSLALEGSHATRDAFLAARLRAAGAVLMAKASMSEWANFRSPRSSSGWCSRGGQGLNPYVLDRTPCGSSSGTGGAVAASYVAAGVGTETDGSVTCPAATMGLVGLKPTVGLVSRSGIIPISVSQDTAGPICRTVTDAALLLGGMVGADPRDPITRAAAPHQHRDFTRFLDPGALRGKRLGVTRKAFTGYHPGTDARFEEALVMLRELGATLVDPADLPHAEDRGADEFQVLLYEFKAGLNAYLAGLGPSAPVRTLDDVIAFNERNRERVMPHFGQETLIEAAAKGPLTTPAYRRALANARRIWRSEGIDQVVLAHRLDALVAPTGNPAWPIDLVNGDHFTGSVTTPAAVAGYPHITVPMGYVAELPVGLSFFGRAWTEPALLGMAYAYEQATRHRRPPRYLLTLPLQSGSGIPTPGNH